MDQKENLLDKDLSLVVILPGGEEKMTIVHGRYGLTTVFKSVSLNHEVSNPTVAYKGWLCLKFEQEQHLFILNISILNLNATS